MTTAGFDADPPLGPDPSVIVELVPSVPLPRLMALVSVTMIEAPSLTITLILSAAGGPGPCPSRVVCVPAGLLVQSTVTPGVSVGPVGEHAAIAVCGTKESASPAQSQSEIEPVPASLARTSGAVRWAARAIGAAILDLHRKQTRTNKAPSEVGSSSKGAKYCEVRAI